ncbi:MAG: hypothetical protein GY777_27320 [Candidatus Brocadiaceae bacterium]|nr:hypothetical protein [Candidatus Brocadiaceae bacterium]
MIVKLHIIKVKGKRGKMGSPQTCLPAGRDAPRTKGAEDRKSAKGKNK